MKLWVLMVIVSFLRIGEGRKRQIQGVEERGSRNSSQFPGKVTSINRHIALKHVGCRVTGDGPEFKDIQAQLGESGKGIVSEVVKGEVFNASPRYSPFIGLLQGIHRHREDMTIEATREGLHHGDTGGG